MVNMRVIKRDHYDTANKITYDIVEIECQRCKKEKFVTITPINEECKYCSECSKVLFPWNYQ